MRKLNVIVLYIWTALAFAMASKAHVNKLHGEWFKVGLRVVQQPLPLDVGHLLLALDPEGRWLHAFGPMAA